MPRIDSDSEKEYQDDYYSRNKNTVRFKASHRLSEIRARAKKNKWDFDLDVDWLASKYIGTCEVTGLPFNLNAPVSNRVFSPSVDRIDNTKGYTKSNCRVILYCVNLFKGTMSDEEMLMVAHELINNIG